MKKMKKYVVALYASAVVGLGTCAYVSYNIIKDKTISEKTVNIGVSGLITYTILWGIGAIGSALDNNTLNNEVKQNKLENNLIK